MSHFAIKAKKSYPKAGVYLWFCSHSANRSEFTCSSVTVACDICQQLQSKAILPVIIDS